MSSGTGLSGISAPSAVGEITPRVVVERALLSTVGCDGLSAARPDRWYNILIPSRYKVLVPPVCRSRSVRVSSPPGMKRPSDGDDGCDKATLARAVAPTTDINQTARCHAAANSRPHRWTRFARWPTYTYRLGGSATAPPRGTRPSLIPQDLP